MTNESSIFSGCIPALMTPCNSDGEPDFGALVAKAKELCEVGMRGVVYCGSMGDWPLLTDSQRMEGVAQLAKAGVPVVVGTGRAKPQTSGGFGGSGKRSWSGRFDGHSPGLVSRYVTRSAASSLRWNPFGCQRLARCHLQ